MFKTGTTTLGRSLEELKFNVFNGPWITKGEIYYNPWNPNISNFLNYKDYIVKKVELYDAFQDYPFMYIYPLLDKWFPGSLFIYTERDPVEVANSDRAMWLRNGVSLWKIPPKRSFIERYQKHQDEVLNYFAERNDFLRINWSSGDGWEKLCDFLNCPVPDCPLPHRNSGNYRLKNKLKLVSNEIFHELTQYNFLHQK